MSLLNSEITYWNESIKATIVDSALDFLNQIDGLTVIDLKGEDQTRCRVVTTLIHGNEPSGFIAIHEWLKANKHPATNLRVIICNPEAAKTKPVFTHRYLGENKDLNRLFVAKNSLIENCEVLQRASQIEKLVKEISPEAILDLHNTSGTSPAFGVAIRDDKKTRRLVELFTNKMILTGLHVGAIMEVDFKAPIATIECGGANDIHSHEVARKGLFDFFTLKQLFNIEHSQVRVHSNPIRVQLTNEASVGFSNHCLPTTDITLRADIEQLNQQHTPKGEFLGWYEPRVHKPLSAIDEHGIEQIESLIEAKEGCLFAKQDLQLYMVTTIAEIATNDCLFYAAIE